MDGNHNRYAFMAIVQHHYLDVGKLYRISTGFLPEDKTCYNIILVGERREQPPRYGEACR